MQTARAQEHVAHRKSVRERLWRKSTVQVTQPADIISCECDLQCHCVAFFDLRALEAAAALVHKGTCSLQNTRHADPTRCFGDPLMTQGLPAVVSKHCCSLQTLCDPYVKGKAWCRRKMKT